MAVRFATTRWSVVLAARDADSNPRQALEWLCEGYWQPVYAYIRRCGHTQDDALELTQEFFRKRIELCDVGRADPQRGRFRSWLIGSLKHFLSNARRSNYARKCDTRKLAWLDAMSAEERYRLEPSDATDPERLYHRAFALAVLRCSMTRLEAEYAAKGKSALFSFAKQRLHGEPDAAWYAAGATTLDMSPEHLKVAMRRLRERWAQVVHREVAEQVAEPEDVRKELAALLDAVQCAA